jgi:hypothetical protein
MMVENRAFVERIAWYSVGIVNLLAVVNFSLKAVDARLRNPVIWVKIDGFPSESSRVRRDP